jgi:hypothetical protein
VPYLVGACGALLALSVARRWSRRDDPPPAPAVGGAADDPELRTRLDHELRDLD